MQLKEQLLQVYNSFLLVAILVAEHVQLQQEIGECEGDEHMRYKIVNEKQA